MGKAGTAGQGRTGNTLDITMQLREHQAEDPVLGELFKALHTFADRTVEEFFYDTPDLPHPVVAMEKDRASRRGFYTVRDGYTLIHRINLNPYALRDGEDAARTLAHELVHLWQQHVGRPCKRNYHSAEFHARMAEYGITTTGKRGTFVEAGGRWEAWMVENEDLKLASFILPGTDQKPKRNMPKQSCPECGQGFRTRRELNVICGDCMVPMELEDK